MLRHKRLYIGIIGQPEIRVILAAPGGSWRVSEKELATP
jgi:hypothetical protein